MKDWLEGKGQQGKVRLSSKDKESFRLVKKEFGKFHLDLYVSCIC